MLSCVGDAFTHPPPPESCSLPSGRHFPIHIGGREGRWRGCLFRAKAIHNNRRGNRLHEESCARRQMLHRMVRNTAATRQADGRRAAVRSQRRRGGSWNPVSSPVRVPQAGAGAGKAQQRERSAVRRCGSRPHGALAGRAQFWFPPLPCSLSFLSLSFNTVMSDQRK